MSDKPHTHDALPEGWEFGPRQDAIPLQGPSVAQAFALSVSAHPAAIEALQEADWRDLPRAGLLERAGLRLQREPQRGWWRLEQGSGALRARASLPEAWRSDPDEPTVAYLERPTDLLVWTEPDEGLLLRLGARELEVLEVRMSLPPLELDRWLDDAQDGWLSALLRREPPAPQGLWALALRVGLYGQLREKPNEAKDWLAGVLRGAPPEITVRAFRWAKALSQAQQDALRARWDEHADALAEVLLGLHGRLDEADEDPRAWVEALRQALYDRDDLDAVLWVLRAADAPLNDQEEAERALDELGVRLILVAPPLDDLRGDPRLLRVARWKVSPWWSAPTDL